MKRYLLTVLLALAAVCAQAGVGLSEIPGLQGDGPVTVYYPTAAEEESHRIGPFALRLAREASPARGNDRLVVISHGSGGSPWVHADLARALVEAGFVVAMPEHRGDSYKDHSEPGPESWKRRPAEVSRAIDAISRDARFGPMLTVDKVGVYGTSAGGHTALTLAGGRWSPAAYRDHCEARIAEDFSSCVGYLTRLHGNFLDGIKKSVALAVIRHRFQDATWQTHTDVRVQAAVASVPFAADFDMASFAKPRIPLGLVTVGKDINQIPRFHSGAVLAACKRCEQVADLPEAGHGALLSPLPPMELLGSVERELLGDPPGFDRGVLPQVDRRIVDFFKRHLLP